MCVGGRYAWLEKWTGSSQTWAPAVFWISSFIYINLNFPNCRTRMFDLVCVACVPLPKLITALLTYPHIPRCPDPCQGPSADFMLCMDTPVCLDPPLVDPAVFLSCLIGLSLKIVLPCETGLLYFGPPCRSHPSWWKAAALVRPRWFDLLLMVSAFLPEFSSLYFKEDNTHSIPAVWKLENGV